MRNVRLPKHERRVQLLSVARGAFAQRGFHATSMNEIADDAGVTKPVLYQHFDSKRDLFQEVLVDIGYRLDASVFNQATRTGSPFEQVEAGFSGYLDFVESDRDGYKIMASGSVREDPEFSREAHAFEAKMARSVADLITIDGLGDEERLALAYGVSGLVEGMVRFWVTNEATSMDRTQLLKQLTNLAWVGLRH